MNMQHSIKDLAKELADEPAESLLLPEETLGSVLQRARLARRLQIDDVATRLRFKSGVIQALENNNLQALGAPVFVRMYLLRYAQLLDLPEHEILARYKALGLDEPPPLRVHRSIKPQAKTSDLRWLGYPVVFIVLGWLIWSGSQQVSIDPLLSKLGLLDSTVTSPKTEAPTKVSAVSAPSPNDAVTDPGAIIDEATELTSPVIASDSVSNILLESAPNPELPFSESTANVAAESPAAAVPSAETILTLDDNSNTSSETDLAAEELNASSETDLAAEEPNASTELLSPATLNDKHELTLEFSDDCWVEVKDSSGERLIYGIAKANELRTVSGSLPFSVKLGNAYAARLKLDGQEVDKALYIPDRGSVSRFSLEAPDVTSNQG